MKLQELLKRHKAISEYVRLTGGRVSATFTHQYLPLFYSSNSLDIVMQNIILALLGNLLQHLGSFSLIKTISISLPAAGLVLSWSQRKKKSALQRIAVQWMRLLVPAQGVSLKPAQKTGLPPLPVSAPCHILFGKIRDTVPLSA